MYVGSCSERQKNEEEAMNEMTYNEAIEWMDSRHWSGTGKGIVRSQALLERLGNPQDKLKFVHVAGTIGKGSVCA